MAENWVEICNCTSSISVMWNDKTVSKTLPVVPEKVTNSIVTNYNSVGVIGRTSTTSVYNNTDDISVSFSLNLHRELGKNANKINDIDKIISLIMAAQYVEYSGDGAIDAPIVTYTFGDTVLHGKQISASCDWGLPIIDGRYMQCTISISLKILPRNLIDRNTIINKNNPRNLNF